MSTNMYAPIPRGTENVTPVLMQVQCQSLKTTTYRLQCSALCIWLPLSSYPTPLTSCCSLSHSLYAPFYTWRSCAVSVWSSGSIFQHKSVRKTWDTENHLAWMRVKCNIYIYNTRGMHSVVHYLDYGLDTRYCLSNIPISRYSGNRPCGPHSTSLKSLTHWW